MRTRRISWVLVLGVLATGCARVGFGGGTPDADGSTRSDDASDGMSDTRGDAVDVFASSSDGTTSDAKLDGSAGADAIQIDAPLTHPDLGASRDATPFRSLVLDRNHNTCASPLEAEFEERASSSLIEVSVVGHEATNEYDLAECLGRPDLVMRLEHARGTVGFGCHSAEGLDLVLVLVGRGCPGATARTLTLPCDQPTSIGTDLGDEEAYLLVCPELGAPDLDILLQMSVTRF